MKSAEEQCPTVLSSDKVKSEIRKTCRDKSHLEPSFTQNAILELAGTHILNKIK